MTVYRLSYDAETRSVNATIVAVCAGVEVSNLTSSSSPHHPHLIILTFSS